MSQRTTPLGEAKISHALMGTRYAADPEAAAPQKLDGLPSNISKETVGAELMMTPAPRTLDGEAPGIFQNPPGLPQQPSLQQHPTLKAFLRRATFPSAVRHDGASSAGLPGGIKMPDEGDSRRGFRQRGIYSYDGPSGPSTPHEASTPQRFQSMSSKAGVYSEANTAISNNRSTANTHNRNKAAGQSQPSTEEGMQQSLQDSLVAKLNARATEKLPFSEGMQQSLQESLAGHYTATQCPYQALTNAGFRISSCLMRLFDVPMCHVSLLGEQRVWFPTKSVLMDVPELPFDEHTSCGLQSCCNYVIVPTEPKVVLVEDTAKDPAFAMSPFVTGKPHIRFYAGAPLVGEGGRRYGTLCVMDTRPRSFNATTLRSVIKAAEQVVKDIESSQEVLEELSFRATQDKRNNMKLQQCITSSPDPVAFMDIRGKAWNLLYFNESFLAACGVETAELMSDGFLDTFQPLRQSWKDIAQTLGDTGTVQTHFRCKTSGEELRLELRPANSDHMVQHNQQAAPDRIAPPGAVCKDEKLTGNLSKCFVFVIVLPDEESEEASQRPEDSRRQENKPLQKSDYSIFKSYRVPEDLKGLLIGPCLGSGPLRKVYLGKLYNNKVTVKVIEAGNAKKMSRAEARALLGPSIDHPNIVRTMFFCRHEEALWIVEEFCDKGTLIQAIERGDFHRDSDDTKGNFLNSNMQLIVHTLHAIADAMTHLHSQGITLSALSGRTILLKTSNDESDPGGFVPKIADFNLLKATDNPSSSFFEAPSHLAPEVLKDGIESEAADIWSFGVLMWEMYMGMRAFQGKNAGFVIFLIMNDRERLTLPQSAPLGYRMIVNSCLRRDPEDRPDFDTVLGCLQVMKELQQSSNSGTATRTRVA